MALCLTGPSHQLHHCWLIISQVLWHSPKGNLTGNAKISVHDMNLKITNWRLQPHRHWVKHLSFQPRYHKSLLYIHVSIFWRVIVLPRTMFLFWPDNCSLYDYICIFCRLIILSGWVPLRTFLNYYIIGCSEPNMLRNPHNANQILCRIIAVLSLFWSREIIMETWQLSTREWINFN